MSPKEIQKRNVKAENLRVLQSEDGQFFVESENGKVLYSVVLGEDAPCTNGQCVVSPVCFNEKESSRGAKNLKYRIILNKPCTKAIEFFNILERVRKDEKWIHDALALIDSHVRVMDSFITSYYDGIRVLEDMKAEYLHENEPS